MKQKIVIFILTIFKYMMFWSKIDDKKITFMTYEGDKLEKDFKLISEELEKDKNYKLVYVLTKYKNTLLGNIKYLFNCIRQLYHMNTSKVVLLDYNNFVVSNLKREGVKVIQIWHASGAIKKFGNDIERRYPIKNYDYVISTSDCWKDIYSSAFNVKKENVVPTGIPRTDKLFQSKKMDIYRERILSKYPEVKGKRVVLYAPTFRGDLVSDYNKDSYKQVDLKLIKEQLGDDYVLIYKLHPWLADLDLYEAPGIINGNKDGLRMLFSITDYLICDYSALIFDFSILQKPMIFFAHDLDQYEKERGTYEDYEKVMPGPICKTEEEVVKAIQEDNFPMDKIEKFKNKYFKYQDGKSTERVVEFIKAVANDKA